MARLMPRSKAIPPLFAVLLCVGFAAGTVLEGWRLSRLLAWNHLVAHPEDIEEVQDLPAEVLLARARHLEREGRAAEALRLYNELENSSDASVRRRARYNIATHYLHDAARQWNAVGVEAYAEVGTLVNLAEESFKSVLREEPQHWDARFNLEYALRIRPPAKEVEKADWTGTKSSVHALLPGTPGGGP